MLLREKIKPSSPSISQVDILTAHWYPNLCDSELLLLLCVAQLPPAICHRMERDEVNAVPSTVSDSSHFSALHASSTLGVGGYRSGQIAAPSFSRSTSSHLLGKSSCEYLCYPFWDKQSTWALCSVSWRDMYLQGGAGNAGLFVQGPLERIGPLGRDFPEQVNAPWCRCRISQGGMGGWPSRKCICHQLANVECTSSNWIWKPIYKMNYISWSNRVLISARLPLKAICCHVYIWESWRANKVSRMIARPWQCTIGRVGDNFKDTQRSSRTICRTSSVQEGYRMFPMIITKLDQWLGSRTVKMI